MSSLPISLYDLVVIGVVFASALLAAVRGFTREVLAIASWGIAAIAALLLHPNLVPFVKVHIENHNIAVGVAIASIFLITLVIVSFITVRLSDFVLDSRIGPLDRSLGFLFGAARGLLICVIAAIFFNWLVPEKMQPDWAKNAKTKPILQTTGDSLLAFLPDNPESLLKNIKKPKPEGDADVPADTGPSTTPPARP
jgi:membrane protein required for colicin V production